MDSSWTRKWILAIEMRRIKVHNNKAKRARVEANLTIDQWKETVEYFSYRCAYCQKIPYHVIEHFMPIAYGGGTTKRNCVPACSICNGIKNRWNPLAEDRPTFPPEMEKALKRVQAYLSSL